MIGKLAKTCSKNFWSLRECLTPRDVSHARDTARVTESERQATNTETLGTREVN